MIAHLKGKLVSKDPASIIIECQGVGYEVKISLQTFSQIGNEESIHIFTHLAIKEDSHTLFGFATTEERDLFRSLIGISGVGGNTAMTILSSISPADLKQAIASEDVALLKRVKGIGAKTAGRIILELKGKLATSESVAAADGVGKAREEALLALGNLGFPKAEMEKKVGKIISEADQELSAEDIIRMALKRD